MISTTALVQSLGRAHRRGWVLPPRPGRVQVFLWGARVMRNLPPYHPLHPEHYRTVTLWEQYRVVNPDGWPVDGDETGQVQMRIFHYWRGGYPGKQEVIADWHVPDNHLGRTPTTRGGLLAAVLEEHRRQMREI